MAAPRPAGASVATGLADVLCVETSMRVIDGVTVTYREIHEIVRNDLSTVLIITVSNNGMLESRHIRSPDHDGIATTSKCIGTCAIPSVHLARTMLQWRHA